LEKALTLVADRIAGGSDGVFHSRAIPSRTRCLEDDPDVMVHQQLARLRFFEQTVGVAGQRVLDFGCGSGFNAQAMTGAQEVLGFDISAAAIALARRSFPDYRFEVADACAPGLSLGTWDRILCCEVLEHVPDMPLFLDNLRNHLASGGVALISTPNREVFSSGHEPSPLNREHIKELDLGEFSALLAPRFQKVKIFGQRFSRPELLDQWRADVKQKIAQLEAGTRWKEPADTLASAHPLLRGVYAVPPVRAAWKWLRWSVIAGIQARARAASRPYSLRDFEFTTGDLSDSLWFCAVVSR
jgi:SAM-dependent methyltransferase